MNTDIRNTSFVLWNNQIAKVYELMNHDFILEVPGCMSRWEKISEEDYRKLRNNWI